MGIVVSLHNLKGGVGKTAGAINLGTGLVGQQVLLMTSTRRPINHLARYTASKVTIYEACAAKATSCAAAPINGAWTS
jgi:hypothetical protein